MDAMKAEILLSASGINKMQQPSTGATARRMQAERPASSFDWAWGDGTGGSIRVRRLIWEEDQLPSPYSDDEEEDQPTALSRWVLRLRGAVAGLSYNALAWAQSDDGVAAAREKQVLGTGGKPSALVTSSEYAVLLEEIAALKALLIEEMLSFKATQLPSVDDVHALVNIDDIPQGKDDSYNHDLMMLTIQHSPDEDSDSDVED
eukprot:gene7620-9075_t